jgi:hypothetical protein
MISIGNDVTYSPDPLTHFPHADCADLYCGPCMQRCSEESPCSCDESYQVPEPEEDRPDATVRLVSDGDVGLSGETTG